MTGSGAATRKHVPQRMCVICRQKMDKRALYRLVYSPDGLHIDPTGKASGRGAYLCENPHCWKRAAESQQLERALRVPLTDADKKLLIKRQP